MDNATFFAKQAHTMFPHHQSTIDRIVDSFSSQAGIDGVLLGGSIAHGFAGETSDVDIMIVVSDDEHRRRMSTGDFHYYNTDLCTYDGGYVDGKFICPSYLDDVERSGSEPARFAFADAQVLFSRTAGLDEQVRRIAQYPVEGKADRIARFYAQLEGWRWYASEGAKRGDDYLLGLAASRVLLFGGRMILAHNETLFPYHKWFTKVLENVPNKPEALMDAFRLLSRERTVDNIAAFCDLVLGYRLWETDTAPWPARFMTDSELTWREGASPVDDL